MRERRPLCVGAVRRTSVKTQPLKRPGSVTDLILESRQRNRSRADDLGECVPIRLVGPHDLAGAQRYWRRRSRRERTSVARRSIVSWSYGVGIITITSDTPTRAYSASRSATWSGVPYGQFDAA